MEHPTRVFIHNCCKSSKGITIAVESICEFLDFDDRLLDEIDETLTRISVLEAILGSGNLSNNEKVLFVFHFYDEVVYLLNLVDVNLNDFLDIISNVFSKEFISLYVTDRDLLWNYELGDIRNILRLAQQGKVREFEEIEYCSIKKGHEVLDSYVVREGINHYHNACRITVGEFSTDDEEFDDFLF